MSRTSFHPPRSSSAECLRVAVFAIALIAWLPNVGAEELPSARPFSEGEVLTYRVSFGLLGGGSGSLRVIPSMPLRDEPVVQLRFDFDGNIGPFPVSNHSRSWLSTTRWASLRYEVEEHSPFQSAQDVVEIFPEELRWVGTRDEGRSVSADALDELSFLYALRALPLTPGRTFRLDRHFDSRRNPALIHVIDREVVRVPAGVFDTVLVEMEVRDPVRCGGRAVVRMNVSADEHRLPVRIASRCPIETLLELQVHQP
jgi:hypothetical protein